MENREESDRLNLALQSSGLGLWDWNMVTGETVFNERWAEIIGYTLAELEPTTIETWMAHALPEDLERSNEAISAHTRGDTDSYDIDVRMKHRNGDIVWVRDRGRVIQWGEDGAPMRMLGTREDITKRVERELALTEAQIVFENSLEGIALLDENEVITSVNPAFTSLTGWSASDVIGISFNDIRSHANDARESQRLGKAARSKSGVRVQRDFFRPDGSRNPMLMSINRVLGPRGEVTRLVAQVSDLSQTVRDAAARVEAALDVDQTTGLLNAHGLRRSAVLDGTETGKNHGRHALMLLRINNLHRLQGAFGFDEAERVVSLVAQRLRNSMGATHVLARMGRDEFGIVFPAVINDDAVLEQAKTFADAASGVYQLSEAGKVLLTCCAGIAFEFVAVDSIDALVREATAALQIASRESAGSIRVYDGDEASINGEHVAVLAEMRGAWDAREFRLAYQPIIAVGSGELIGVEALMRWDSKRYGSVSPAEFIPLAEESGLIIEMGTWAIREAAAECARFRSAGLQIDVAVNVSAQQMTRDGFVTIVEEAVARAGIPGDALILELTESTLYLPSQATLNVLERLRELGVRLSIDDFGTGYSSFTYLYQFRLDRLKIDRSFIREIDQRPEARAIVTGTINLGHNLGMQVVAEGVENQAQLGVLEELQCDFFQGLLTSPAVDPSTVMKIANIP